MSGRACLRLALPAFLLALTGCQRLNDERTVHVPAAGFLGIEYSAPRYGQKLQIQIRSPGAPVSVYLVREEDREAAESQIAIEKAPASPLASKEKAEDINLEVEVPAKTAYAVLICAHKKDADVHVQVKGR
jgi:hypothetical protein